LGAAPWRVERDPPSLGVRLWGLNFPNPVGLAAGFDKDAQVPGPLLRWGFGFVEIGTVTPRPQPGNPKPRLFRLPEDRAVINRMGFNSRGLDVAADALRTRPAGIVGANLGKNRDSKDATTDYCLGATRLGPLVDYLVINISSPNTPGLRDLQRRHEASRLVEAVAAARASLGAHQPPLLLKIAPDLTPREVDDLGEVALGSPVDGIILSNTTTARPETLRSPAATEPGGLSGQPLFDPSTDLLGRFYRLTGGRVPLIGVGGIGSGAQAYAKICAGASLVQLYTAMVYQGPGLVRTIKQELAQCLERDGFRSITEAVGCRARSKAMGVNRQGA
jgi:dihydroorotate dehydrogenase